MGETTQAPFGAAKDWVTKQEQRLGATFSIVAVGFGALALWAARDAIIGLLNFAISAVGRMVILGALSFAAVVLVMLAMNPRTWTELWHFQARIARWVSGWAMRSDPFGRMRAFADEFLQGQWNKFNDAATRIEAQLQSVRGKIKNHEAKLAESTKMVESLSSRYMDDRNQWTDEQKRDTFRLESQRIQFTESALKKLRVSENTLATLVKIVDRWRNTFSYEIESTRMSADFLEAEWNQANDTAGALESVSSVFGKGDMAKADQEVRAYIEKLTANRMAQAEVLMKQIPELTAIGDLRADMAEDEITARLTRLDAESQRALVEVQEDRRLIQQGGSAKAVVETIKEPVRTRRYLK